MTTSSHSVERPRANRGRLIRTLAFVALAGAAGVATAVGIGAHSASAGGWHHGAMAVEFADPAERAAHIERMLQHVYIEIDATDEQQARLEPIFKQAAADLMPLHAQFRDGHAQVLDLLQNETVDREAIEALREQHLQMADQASRTLTALMADVAEVLTPEQRAILIARVKQHHGGGHG